MNNTPLKEKYIEGRGKVKDLEKETRSPGQEYTQKALVLEVKSKKFLATVVKKGETYRGKPVRSGVTVYLNSSAKVEDEGLIEELKRQCKDYIEDGLTFRISWPI